MENLGEKVLIRCLITIPQPSEFIEVVECWCFSFWKEVGRGGFFTTSWNVNYDPGRRTETPRLGVEWKGKYKAAVVWAGTGTEAETGTGAEWDTKKEATKSKKLNGITTKCEGRAGI